MHSDIHRPDVDHLRARPSRRRETPAKLRRQHQGQPAVPRAGRRRAASVGGNV